MKEIQNRRGEIDRIDAALVRLLNQRTRLAIEIARLKTRGGLSRYSRRRELEVLARACRSNPGPLGERAVLRLFRQILRESRRAQVSLPTATGRREVSR